VATSTGKLKRKCAFCKKNTVTGKAVYCSDACRKQNQRELDKLNPAEVTKRAKAVTARPKAKRKRKSRAKASPVTKAKAKSKSRATPTPKAG